jgi:hypothetical protein
LPCSLFLEMKSSSLGLALVLVAALQGPAPYAATTLQIISLPIRLSELVGMEVKSFAGRRLGSVDDLVVDLANGRVRYAILDTRHRTVPVPFHTLELSLLAVASSNSGSRRAVKARLTRRRAH